MNVTTQQSSIATSFFFLFLFLCFFLSFFLVLFLFFYLLGEPGAGQVLVKGAADAQHCEGAVAGGGQRLRGLGVRQHEK